MVPGEVPLNYETLAGLGLYGSSPMQDLHGRRVCWPPTRFWALGQGSLRMPMLAFLPWATVTERLSFGKFQILPLGEALLAGDIPQPSQDAVTAILESYGHSRPVDRAYIPLLRSGGTELLADLNEDQIEAYFDFRFRLAFAALAARDFFGHRYCNSDSLRLVIQGFSPERGGSALIITRRRDGATRNIVARGALRVMRPLHLSWCELPRDLDAECLRSLESAMARQDAAADSLKDALQVFVGANTDSPDVSVRTELVESVGAFSRLFDVWRERETVDAFIGTLPPPLESDVTSYGNRVARDPLQKMLSSGKSVREAWLTDAYILRGQYAHGHVDDPPYKSGWTLQEHLLLAAYIFPLTVKATLGAAGQYIWTERDQAYSDAFDTLATLEMFSGPTLEEELEGEESLEKDPNAWRETLSRYRMRPLVAELARALQAEAEKPVSEQEPLGEEETDQQNS